MRAIDDPRQLARAAAIFQTALDRKRQGINFTPPPVTLYRAFDSADRLLYIGISESFDKRRRHHELSTEWAQQADRWATEEYASRDAAMIAELAAIKAERPLHNRQGLPRAELDILQEADRAPAS